MENDIFAWYDGETYDLNEHIWHDKSGYCRLITSEFVSGTVGVKDGLNSHKYLAGTTSTSLQFPPDVLPLV